MNNKMVAFSKLKAEKRYGDIFILFRFFYRIGESIVDDSVYDKLERAFRAEGSMTEYTNRTYDDDPIPFELLKELNLLEYLPDMKVTSKYAKWLDMEKSLSIRSVVNDDETWEFIVNHLGEDLIFSKKMDGANTKTAYIDGNYELSLSRGRHQGCFDYSKGASKVLPLNIKSEDKLVKVYAEAFVLGEHLEELRNKYDPDRYKVPKGAAISLLRVSHALEDYQFLKMVAIDIECNKQFKTVEDKFKYLEYLGFEVPVYKVVKAEDIPRTKEEFSKFLFNICDYIYKEKGNYLSDGMVVQVNNLGDVNVTNQYGDNNIAVKYNHWKPGTYIGIVEDIITTQKRVEASVRLKIKPLQTRDGCSANYVTGFNPSVLIENNINIGSEIKFERSSNTVNVLKYKE